MDKKTIRNVITLAEGAHQIYGAKKANACKLVIKVERYDQ